MLTQPQRRRLIAKLDALCRECVMLMARGECQYCCAKAHDVHHVIRKGHGGGNVKARICVYNCLALCRLCHGMFHDKGQKWEYGVIEANYPAVWAYVQDYKPSKGTVPASWLRDQEETLTKIRDTLKGRK